MVSVHSGSPIHSIKLSSVVPAAVTGETTVHELSNMDLAMKLHYMRTVYYFRSEAVEGLNIMALKKPMFKWLDYCCSVAGRVRKSESGRPFVKCTDSGVRIVEAQCSKTIDEWLEMKENSSLHKYLVSSKAIGPDLLFSPLVYLQILVVFHLLLSDITGVEKDFILREDKKWVKESLGATIKLSSYDLEVMGLRCTNNLLQKCKVKLHTIDPCGPPLFQILHKRELRAPRLPCFTTNEFASTCYIGAVSQDGIEFQSGFHNLMFTKFSCGGMAIGFSWSHLMGDYLTAIKFINMWGQLLAENLPPSSIQLPRAKVEKPEKLPSYAAKPLSVKQVEPVGDCWIATNSYKMDSFSFHISKNQMKHLQSKFYRKIAPFEAISAIIWQCVAQIRKGREPRTVTVCRKGPHAKANELLSNKQVISTVVADFSVADAKLFELANLVAKGTSDESKEIEELVEIDNGTSDFIVYGTNLTFVNIEEADLYGLELRGQKPVHVNVSMDGVGDEGVVLVLRAPESGSDESDEGRTVTVTLPENQLLQLRNELKREWLSTLN